MMADSDKQKHVMISYKWSEPVQEKMKELKNFLASNGIKTWMDVDDMGNNILESMVYAVENAAVVLVAMNEEYQNSQPCKDEATNSHKKMVPIVPLLLQCDYKPTGWLEFIMQYRKYVNLSSNDYKQKFNDVLDEVRRLMNNTDAPQLAAKPALVKPTSKGVTETSAEQQTGTPELHDKASSEPGQEMVSTSTKRKDDDEESAVLIQPSRKILKAVENSPNEAGQTTKGRTRQERKTKCNPSKLNEFENYAKDGPSRLSFKSHRPHVIMGNVEKLTYENDMEQATAELERFFEQLRFQSDPTSENLRNCAESVTKKNPLRKALFLAASSCKGAREKGDGKKMTFDVAGQIYEIYNNLVKPLTGQANEYDEVLDSNLLSKGAHAMDIAKCILQILREMYERGFADTSNASRSKSYSLKWLLVSYYKTRQYTDAIKLAQDKTSEYIGLNNESVVGIHTTLGLCLQKTLKYDDALAQFKEARTMTNKIFSDWTKKDVSKVESSQDKRAEARKRLEDKLLQLNRYIREVKTSRKRHQKA